MLQTCTRCRTRRIKCDSRLPACANCARNDLECTFHDTALQEDIPRSYIESLNKRIDHLTSQLALHRTDIPSFETQHAERLPRQSLHILAPAKPGSELHLDLSVLSCIARVVFEALPVPQTIPQSGKELLEDEDLPRPNIPPPNRSQLVPSIMRFLLRRYGRCIKPRYDIQVPDLIDTDGGSFARLSEPHKFKVLMACAIAAAREAYKYPDWRPFAEICRDWANELLTPILCAGDTDTLVAITLLLVYELADPRRGIVWELLDLAARTCLQLGWHQTSHGSSSKKTVEHNVDTMSHTSLYSQGEINLMLVLRDIASSLQTVFNRPNMLRHLNLPHRAPQERLIELHIRTSDLIYGAGRLCEIKACPCVGEASILMGLLESVDRSHLVVKETWLLYLPLCLKHRQCVHCFQEPGEPTARGMTWLRRNLMKSASELIAEVHRDATLTEGFTPPIIASARSLIAGLAITTGIFKEWIVLGPHVRDIILCTEILTMFAPHWCGGQGYLRVWRTLLDHIQFGSLQLR